LFSENGFAHALCRGDPQPPFQPCPDAPGCRFGLVASAIARSGRSQNATPVSVGESLRVDRTTSRPPNRSSRTAIVLDTAQVDAV
jgi:hypothetical protein